jgi:hypothetical protein
VRRLRAFFALVLAAAVAAPGPASAAVVEAVRVSLPAVSAPVVPVAASVPLLGASLPALAPAPALSPVSALAAAEAPSAAPPAAPAAAKAAPVPVAAAAPASLPKSDEGKAWRFSAPWWRAARLFDGARRVESLGAGAMGSVFAHPSRPDAVVKVAREGYAETAGQYMGPGDETVLDWEDADLSRLADAGAAPRPLARTTVSGRPASVRERVRGRTVRALKRSGAYGPRESALTRALIDRVAQAGLVARDLNLGNIMIGRRAGDAEDRAWIVDTLGVFERPGDPAAARAEMMRERGVRAAAVSDDEPLAWSRPKRWLALAGLLTALAAAPPVLHALTLAPLTPLALTSRPFASWTAFALTAGAAAVAGLPVRVLAHRLAPWTMRWHSDSGDKIMREPPLKVVPLLAVGAASEEFVFRGFVFLGGAAALVPFLPLWGALAAASLGSSLVIALIHGYGSVWTRVVGGMIYAAALMASGTLLLPFAIHFSFNLFLYLRAKLARG